MITRDQKQLDQWVQTWQRTQVAQKTVHTSELRNIDYQKQMDLLDEMLTYACNPAGKRALDWLNSSVSLVP